MSNLQELIERVKNLTDTKDYYKGEEMNKYPDEPCVKGYPYEGERLEPTMTLQKFDPIVYELTRYAEAAGRLEERTRHLNRHNQELARVEEDCRILQAEHDKLKKNRDLWYDEAIKLQNKEYARKEKARRERAKKTTKKVVKKAK
jgi:hypothetical protein